jgi:hypothetical protein
MCECQKEAKLFLSAGNLFWGWYCSCSNGWRSKFIAIVTLKDIKSELIKEVYESNL